MIVVGLWVFGFVWTLFDAAIIALGAIALGGFSVVQEFLAGRQRYIFYFLTVLARAWHLLVNHLPSTCLFTNMLIHDPAPHLLARSPSGRLLPAATSQPAPRLRQRHAAVWQGRQRPPPVVNSGQHRRDP